MNEFTRTGPVAPRGPGVLPRDEPSKRVCTLGALGPSSLLDSLLEQERIRIGRAVLLSSPAAARSQKRQPSVLASVRVTSPLVGRAELSKSVLLLRNELASADSARVLSSSVSAAPAVEDLASCTATPEATPRRPQPTSTFSDHSTGKGFVASTDEGRTVKGASSRFDLS